MPPSTAGGRKGDGRRQADTSFAIALSTGPIREVKRIWADGREIRSVSGVFAFQTTMRLHSAPVVKADPLILAAEGDDGAPALRGLSHVVFEGFPLAPFGNRIPSLSFELVADVDAGDGWLAKVAAEAAIAVGSSLRPIAVRGFASSGVSRSEDLRRLSRIAGAELTLDMGRLQLSGGAREFAVSMDEQVSAGSGADDSLQSVKTDAPAGLSLTYIDPDREYQRGLQRVGRDRAGPQLQLSWAMTSSADAAIRLSNRLLLREEASSDRLTMVLPPRWLHLSVGDEIRREDGGRWRIIRRDIRNLTVIIEAERSPIAETTTTDQADPGRSLPEAVVPAGATSLIVFEAPVPVFGNAAAVMVAGGGGVGWRGADIRLLAGGEDQVIGRLDANQGFGELVEALSAGPATIWDERNAIVVRLMGIDGLLSRDVGNVLAGAGLVLVGNELIQFRDIHRIGGDLVRLSGLLRGRFGTRIPDEAWPAGTRFAELPSLGAAATPMPAEAIGRDLAFAAEGRGDPPGGTAVLHRVEGQGVAPLAPAHLVVRLQADGVLMSSWVERGRSAWTWAAEGIVPPQRFLWRMRIPSGGQLELPVETTILILNPDQQLALLGEQISSGECQVEAMGDGPAWIRRSGWVRF